MNLNRLYLTLLPIILPLILCHSNAEAADRIEWMITHWPPVMELDEKEKRVIGGQWGGQLQAIQKRLYDFEHINIKMSWNRFWKLIRQGHHICSCMVLKNPERELIAEYSLPATIILPNHVIVKKETHDQMGTPDSISLAALLQNNRFKGILIQKRSYASDIDTILSRYETPANIEWFPTDEINYLKMLIHGRCDYIIEYPFTIHHILTRYLPEYKGRVVSIPISETQPFYHVYYACPKNPWGINIISAIDRVLQELRTDEAYRAHMNSMYEAGQLKTVQRLFDRHFQSLTPQQNDKEK